MLALEAVMFKSMYQGAQPKGRVVRLGMSIANDMLFSGKLAPGRSADKNYGAVRDMVRANITAEWITAPALASALTTKYSRNITPSSVRANLARLEAVGFVKTKKKNNTMYYARCLCQ